MKNFTYFRPTSVEQAVGLLENRWGNTELLAGGTDLHDLQKEYVAQPTRVISLGGINNFSGISADRDNNPRQVVIRAGTNLADIASNALLRQHFPGLTAAAGMVGGPQIRNMGTLGGNLCQRNRCWYFRDEHVSCLLRGGENCAAAEGENRYHAVFTQGVRCPIVNPSTLAPVLVALGATAQVQGANGQRNIELSRFFRAPENANQREHVLAPNDVLVSVTIPVRGLRNASYEIRSKQSWDWPLVQAAVAFEFNNNRASNGKVVLGHVAPTPHLAEQATQTLNNNNPINEEKAALVGQQATQGARPLSQNAYKTRLIPVAVKRAIITAAGQQRYWES